MVFVNIDGHLQERGIRGIGVAKVEKGIKFLLGYFQASWQHSLGCSRFIVKELKKSQEWNKDEMAGLPCYCGSGNWAEDHQSLCHVNGAVQKQILSNLPWQSITAKAVTANPKEPTCMVVVLETCMKPCAELESMSKVQKRLLATIVALAALPVMKRFMEATYQLLAEQFFC
ncbi:hypothetical protein BDN71DRAFT_1431071 [Pleurotus eryngii]|uniref:Uncharacterized protein n=1 Tax=Pleurotus eryngii TaxID=5323 RepID=A0A9P6DG16_PLEER|nr:hypothetical protein BDN71DRAFT_1431071 [Pleurotus eryngii]